MDFIIILIVLFLIWRAGAAVWKGICSLFSGIFKIIMKLIK